MLREGNLNWLAWQNTDERSSGEKLEEKNLISMKRLRFIPVNAKRRRT